MTTHRCPANIDWRISSFSTNGGSCVAVADLGNRVLVRNSSRPDRGTLVVSLASVAEFVAGCRHSEFDDCG